MERLFVDFDAISNVPSDPFRLVRTLRTNKALYDRAVEIAAAVSGSKPEGFPPIRVEHTPFCPPGHIYGMDVNNKVVLLLGPKVELP